MTHTRSFGSFSLELGRPLWLLLAVTAAAAATGCTTVPTVRSFVAIEHDEGPRWVAAETVTRYGCNRGVLTCESEGGRLSERRCRCPATR